MKNNDNQISEEEIVVVIPTLEPTTLLIDYANHLISKEFLHIVVINDGSSDKYNSIFEKLNRIDECTVITHDENRGKGAALKTGYQFIKDHFPKCQGVITVDSDGQHTIEDVCKIAKKLATEKGCLLLGCRNFSLPSIPIKSRIGNRLSSVLFLILYGKWIGDTQTGLRRFDINLLDEMIQVEGERFEYEMQVIISCIIKKIPIKQIEIQTIYENNNKSTHFQAIHDSVKIAKVIFSNFSKFFSSSIISSLVDITIAWFLLDLFRNNFANNDLLRIALATCLARVVSMLVNYSINKKVVFKDKNTQNKSFVKYILLCIPIMLLSTILVYITHHFFQLNDKIMKILVDSLLFLLSYKLQQNWVFNKSQKRRK